MSAAVAVVALSARLATAQPAGTYTVLHTFDPFTEGSGGSDLLLGTDGNFYGTTGGVSPSSGTIFRMTPAGDVTILYALHVEDGVGPRGLIQASDGNFYGMTGPRINGGTVFRLTPAGTFSTLHAFDGADGFNPSGPLVEGTDGNFYGSTWYGGSSGCRVPDQGLTTGCGTIFRITPAGTFSVLHTFIGGTDGAKPSPLIQASDGNFYGTTKFGGGTGCFGAGCGTIFKITPGGVVSILHSFTDPRPVPSSLIQATDGNFYGTTGANLAWDVYRMTPGGVVTVLHTFTGPSRDPAAPLIQATDGTFYGTTPAGAAGGTTYVATVFRMTSAGDVTVVHKFDPDWTAPSSLVQAANGNLCGTTTNSINGGSVAFELTLTGAPVITAQPQSQTITAAQTATMTVGAVGSGLSFQWYAGTSGMTSAPIAGATSSSYTTPALTTTTSYWARVSNASGSVDSATATILIGVAPTIATQPVNRTVTEGQSVSFTVVATGTPSPSYQWQVSTNAGASWTNLANVAPYTGASAATLTVASTTGLNGARYRCVVTNGIGPSLTSSVATLVVRPIGDVPMPGDYDGDGKTDITVYRPSTTNWFVLLSSANYTNWNTYQWGTTTPVGDIPVPADYDGDHKTDIAIYRPSSGTWYILTSSSGFIAGAGYAWGVSGDVPVTGDFDGDGRADITVYRPSTGNWFVLRSSTNYTTWSTYQWGVPGDIPVPGDYDGDGKTDLAIYRPSTAVWWILLSSTNYSKWNTYQWGTTTPLGDIPVAADYDGDRKTDIAIYRPSNGTWYILTSSSGFTAGQGYPWGIPGDVPMLGDYDGDGRTDITVYRPSTGNWFVLLSSRGYNNWLTYDW